jgi:hypothetical protein
MNKTAFQQAVGHGVKIAAWVVGSAVIPALLSLYSGNQTWLLLTPVINAVGAGLVKWSGLKASGVK